MKRQLTASPRFIPGTTIRIRIDHRTVITVRTEEAAKTWLSRYPKATIIE
jgi:hypothetical protein